MFDLNDNESLKSLIKMRQNQFPTPSILLENIKQQETYAKHRLVIESINAKKAKRLDGPYREREIVENHDKIMKSRTTRAMRQVDDENFRILRKLIDIRHGKTSNVAKADDWKKSVIRNSPLEKYRGHKNLVAENQKIHIENQRMLNVLTSVRSTKSIDA